MRCLTCHYSLKGLTENRCPECGREFDPNMRATFMTEMQYMVSRDDRIFWLGVGLTALCIAVGVALWRAFR